MMKIISMLAGTAAVLVLAGALMAQSAKPAKPALSNSGLQASIARGKQVYAEQCLSCHQADGGGVSNMNPPLIKTKWVLGDKSTLIHIVLKGMNT